MTFERAVTFSGWGCKVVADCGRLRVEGVMGFTGEAGSAWAGAAGGDPRGGAGMRVEAAGQVLSDCREGERGRMERTMTMTAMAMAMWW